MDGYIRYLQKVYNRKKDKMKGLIFGALSAMCMWSSCSYDETINSLVEKQQMDGCGTVAQSRSTDNVLIVNNGNAQFMEMNWTGDYYSYINNAIKESKDAHVYAYNGKGGKFVSVDTRPGLEYKQTGEWLDAEFQYAVMDGTDSRNEGEDLDWQNAFGHLTVHISNKEKGLHLQVNGIRLCQVSTEGTFLFPGEETAEWVYNNGRDVLSYNTDTLNITDNMVSLPAEGGFPIIPQEKKAWTATRNPGLTSGAYILLNCRIFNICNPEEGYREGMDVPIWCDSEGGFSEVAIPVELKVMAGEFTHLDLTLESNCEWYSINGTFPQTILQPIEFDASVGDWLNGNSTNINVD